MKKSRIFMATATAVLAIVAVFATKANKKFALISTAYIGPSVVGWYLVGTSSFLTTKNTTPQIQMNMFYTNSGALEHIAAASGDLTDKATGHEALYK
jgi:hypothetical protein